MLANRILCLKFAAFCAAACFYFPNSVQAQALLPFVKTGKWGYMDTTGKIVLKPKFRAARPFSEGLAWVRQDETSWSLINPKGKLVRNLRPLSGVQEFYSGVAVVERDALRGAVDKKGEVVLPIQFSDIHYYSPTLLYTEKQGLISLFNLSVKAFIPGIYQQVLAEGNGLIPVRQPSGFWGFIDATGSTRIDFKYSNVLPFSNGRAWVRVAGLWGVIDTLGRTIMSPQFDRTTYGFVNGYADVRVGPFEGVVDSLGYIIVPPEYDAVGYFQNGRAWFKKQHACGFFDQKGQIVVPPLYDDVSGFSEGLARVSREGHHGYIDTSGQEVIGLVFQAAGDFHLGRAVVKQEGRWGVTDKRQLPVVPYIYDAVEEVQQGYFLVRKGQSYGLYDSLGVEVLPAQFARIEVLENGLIFALEEDFQTGILTLSDGDTSLVSNAYRLLAPLPGGTVLERHPSGSYLWYNAEGRLVQAESLAGLQPQDDKSPVLWATVEGETSFQENPTFEAFVPTLPTASLLTERAKWGAFDIQGRERVPYRFEHVAAFNNELARVSINGKWGLARPDGAIIVEPDFDFIGADNGGHAIVRVEDKYGAIDLSGAFILRPVNDYVFYLGENMYEAGILKDDLYGQQHYFSSLVNLRGEEVTSRYFDLLEPFSQARAPFRDSLWGFLDTNANVVIAPAFEDVKSFVGNYAPALGSGKWGFITMYGLWAVEPKYEEALPFSEGVAAVRLGGKWGFVDPKDSVRIRFLFEEALPFRDGVAPVRLNGLWGLVNKQGVLVAEPQYDKVEWFTPNHYKVSIAENRSAWVQPRGQLKYRHGLLRNDGAVVWPCDLAAVTPPVEGRVAFLRRGSRPRIGYLRPDGKWVLPPQN